MLKLKARKIIGKPHGEEEKTRMLVEARKARSPHIYFASRRDRMKILYFDGSSLWVCARRMEGGRLRWPEDEGGRVQLSREEFALLLRGIDLRETTIRVKA